MSKKTHAEVMDALMNSKSVKDYMRQEQVQLGIKILKRRLELGLTQMQVVALSKERNVPITQAQLSKIENGDPRIKITVYKKALETLGGHIKVDVDFNDPTSEKELQTISLST